MLAPHLSEPKQKATEQDWLEDSHGGDYMTYNLFCDGIFELTDLWCPGATAVEYEHFATSLLNRVLVKEVEEDGRTKVIYPSISYKFIPELQANEHWADKLYAEDIEDLKLQEMV